MAFRDLINFFMLWFIPNIPPLTETKTWNFQSVCYGLRVTVFSDRLEACFNVKMVLNRLDYGINNLVFTKIIYINNALLIIQPGVEIPCFIFGLPWYIVQYTP